jgi:serine/threonine-protein kinase
MPVDLDEECPDENVLADYVDQRTSDVTRSALEAHLDRCPRCLALTCDLARFDGDATVPDSGPPSPGDDGEVAGGEVGRYRILRLVGRGAMGLVYAARDTQLDRRVALKVLRRERLSQADARDRLLREARAMARLSHPNVVTVHDAGEADGRTFIAMEFVEGVTLATWLTGQHWSAALRALMAAGRGLAAAHAAGIVHRDFKPENVLVDPTGRVAVTDFGLAATPRVRAVGLEDEPDAAPAHVSTTQTGTLLGTPRYMSPEQHAGRKVDARTDQFAFAVVLYEALYGVRPFAGTTVLELRDSVTGGHVRDAPPGTDVPAALHASILRALSPDPDDRHAGLAQMLDDLETHAVPPGAKGVSFPAPAPDDAAPPTPPPTATTRSAAHRWIPFLLALSVMAVAAVVAVGLRARRESTGSKAPAALIDQDAAAKPATLLDGPIPKSSSPDALAAYHAGLVAEHDGLNDCFRQFQRAAELDPQLAEAYVHILTTLGYSSGAYNHDAVLDAYRHALALRDRLAPRDRGVLDAFETAVLHQPPDWATTEARFRALLRAAPDDAYVTFLLGGALLVQGKLAEAGPVIERSLALDPQQIRGWLLEYDLQQMRGDLAGARQSSTRCLAVSPGATLCLIGLIDLDDADGKCAESEALAQRFIATSPGDNWGYIDLFEMELARGEPEAAAIETERSVIAHAEPEVKEWASIRYPWLRAVARGDFAQASGLLDQQVALAVREQDHVDEVKALDDSAELALEEGDVARAGALASECLDKMAALPRSPVSEDGMLRDWTPMLLRILKISGRLSDADAAARRDAWLRSWESRAQGEHADFLWLQAYARPAVTRQDALEALAHLPEDTGPLVGGLLLEPEALGRMYLLAGRAETALPLLERAADQCFVRRFPLEIPRARYLVGLAHEALGDRPKACAAYREMIRKWGGARPRSVTASQARQHARALGCGPDR